MVGLLSGQGFVNFSSHPPRLQFHKSSSSRQRSLPGLWNPLFEAGERIWTIHLTSSFYPWVSLQSFSSFEWRPFSLLFCPWLLCKDFCNSHLLPDQEWNRLWFQLHSLLSILVLVLILRDLILESWLLHFYFRFYLGFWWFGIEMKCFKVTMLSLMVVEM